MVAFLSVWACLPVFRFRYAWQKNPLRPLPLVPVSSRRVLSRYGKASWQASRAVFVLLGDNIYGDTRDMEKLKSDGTPSGLSPNSRNFVPIAAFLRSGMITITGRTMPVGSFPKKPNRNKSFLISLANPRTRNVGKRPGFTIA